MTQAFEVVGQMSNASNTALLIKDKFGQYIYKPISGERPLWDFPDGTLAARERAAFVLSDLLGWNLVPRTRLMDGPLGFGSVQDWVDADGLSVDLFPIGEVPENWITVMTGQDEHGKKVVLAHSSDENLQRVALFDVLANNADRKASHILTSHTNEHFVIDHGVTFHHEMKLRTVLWGWIDHNISESDLVTVEQTLAMLPNSELGELLSAQEFDALVNRFEVVLEQRKFPPPSAEWPAIPWPVF